MAAGRSFRIRPCMIGVTYCILVLLTTLTVGYSEERNAQQNDDNKDINLHVNKDSSALKQDDAQLADSTSDVNFSSKEITEKENCHIDGTCGPSDITSTNPAESLDPAEQTEASSIENDISNSKDTNEQIDSREKVQDQEKSQNNDNNINNESKLPSQNDSMDGNNSSVYQWIKFILDPIIEEFKDGIYPKLTEKVNTTEPEISVVNENATVNIESSNETVVEVSNTTETESASNVTETGKKVKFECTGRNVTDNINATVKLITTAKLLQLLNFDKNDTDNVTDCLLVMFYAPWCHFCAKIAPHYNALARAFPQLDFVAVDTAQFSNLLARFGTVSVPNILVFHQSRAAVKFNQTDRTFENFVTFITNSTGLEPNKTVNVTEIDYLGPVPSVPTNEPDYLLLISWIFVIFCSSYMFIKSNKGQQWINRVRVLWVLWQEHQHID